MVMQSRLWMVLWAFGKGFCKGSMSRVQKTAGLSYARFMVFSL